MLYQVCGICTDSKKVIYEGKDINEAINAEIDFIKNNFESFMKTSWYCKDTEYDARGNIWFPAVFGGLTKEGLLTDKEFLKEFLEDT